MPILDSFAKPNFTSKNFGNTGKFQTEDSPSKNQPKLLDLDIQEDKSSSSYKKSTESDFNPNNLWQKKNSPNKDQDSSDNQDHFMDNHTPRDRTGPYISSTDSTSLKLQADIVIKNKTIDSLKAESKLALNQNIELSHKLNYLQQEVVSRNQKYDEL